MRRAALTYDYSTSTHPGLWLDKMLPAEPGRDKEGQEFNAPAKAAHLRKLERAQVPEGYKEAYCQRATSLIEEGAVLFHAQSLGRVIVGLGARGVLEAGLCVDRTWGVPILPGSALKGLAASAAHLFSAQHSEQGKEWRKPVDWPRAPASEVPTHYQDLFGTASKVGLVTFHDAWWIPSRPTLPLDPDIMTVHHPKYYQHGRIGEPPAPTDFDSPTPIPFVTVQGAFLVALAGPAVWCEAARTLLETGLRELGIGAKTSSGYGRLALKKPGQDELSTARSLPGFKRKEFREHVGRTERGDTGWPEMKRAVQEVVTAWRRANAGAYKTASADEKAWFDARTLTDTLAATPSEPPAAAAPTQPSSQPQWLSGKAWLTESGARRTLHVKGDRKKIYERATKDVELDGRKLSEFCPLALAEATDVSPVKVLFRLRNASSDKIDELTLA